MLYLGDSWPVTDKLGVPADIKTFIFEELVTMADQFPEDGTFFLEKYDTLFGGGYYIVRDVEEARALVPEPRPYDRADSFGGHVALTMCTNNAGGNTYIFTADVVKQVPAIGASVDLTVFPEGVIC
jgi:hypothetical protein